MPLTKKRTTNQAKDRKQQSLNVRDLPTKVTGLPEMFFSQYCLEIHITGANQLVRVGKLLDQNGLPGRRIHGDDINKLAKGAGLVRALEKTSTKTKATEGARAFYFNTKTNPDTLKDPKVFHASLLKYSENLKDNKKVVDEATSSIPENTVLKNFMYDQLDRAKDALEHFHAAYTGGEKITIKEAAADTGLFTSMMGKTITDLIRVNQGQTFWESLIGKDPAKFANITLSEYAKLSAERKQAFFGDTLPAQIDTLVHPATIKGAYKIPGESVASEAQKEKYLANQIPVNIGLNKTALLNRAISAKTMSRVRQTGVFPAIDTLTNSILKEFFITPPAAIAELEDYWTSLAGKPLDKPDLASKDYKIQTFEELRDTKPQQPISEVVMKDWPTWRAATIQGVDIELLSSKDLTHKGVESNWKNFQPESIVGKKNDEKKKKKAKRKPMKNSSLTEESKKYFRGLRRRNLPKSLLEDIESYLCSFVEDGLQTMAARIVYLTCELEEETAREHFFMEEPKEEEEEEDDDGSEEGDPDEGEDEGEDELPDPPSAEELAAAKAAARAKKGQ